MKPSPGNLQLTESYLKVLLTVSAIIFSGMIFFFYMIWNFLQQVLVILTKTSL